MAPRRSLASVCFSYVLGVAMPMVVATPEPLAPQISPGAAPAVRSQGSRPGQPSQAAPARGPVSAADLERLAEQRYAEDDLEGARALYLDLAHRQQGQDEKCRLLVTAAWLEYLSKDEAQARHTLIRALSLYPDYGFRPELYSQAFVRLYEASLAEVESQNRFSSNQLVRQGMAAMEAARYGEARTLFEEARQHTPDDPASLYNLALLDFREGNHDAALTGLQRLLALDRAGKTGDRGLSLTRKAQVLNQLGLLYYTREFYDDARRVLVEALQIDPSNSRAWSNLGLTYRKLDRFSDAVEAFSRAQGLAPEDGAVVNNLALAYMDAKDWGKAYDLLAKASLQQPGNARIWLNLGLVNRAQGNLAGAQAALRQVIQLDPENRAGLKAQAASYVALVSYEERQYASSIAAARQALDLAPEDVKAWIYLGLSQSALGQLGDARDSLEEAWRLDPTRPETANNLGSVYFNLGQLVLAEEAFGRAVAMHPGFAAARNNLDLTRQRLTANPSPGGPADAGREIEGKPPVLKGEPRRAEVGQDRSPASLPPTLGTTFSDARLQVSGLAAVRVDSVSPTGLGARAGLKPGDLILRVDREAITGARRLMENLQRRPPGSSVVLDLLRQEKPLRLRLDIESWAP